jgi:hypothetical protein
MHVCVRGFFAQIESQMQGDIVARSQPFGHLPLAFFSYYYLVAVNPPPFCSNYLSPPPFPFRIAEISFTYNFNAWSVHFPSFQSTLFLPIVDFLTRQNETLRSPCTLLGQEGVGKSTICKQFMLMEENKGTPFQFLPPIFV